MKKYFTLILATFVLVSYAQAQSVLNGKVSDVNGEAMIGVSIYLKGTALGTSTDLNGLYQLNLPSGSENGTLVLSFIGYVTQEISIAGRSEINVVLQEDAQALQEVVITGYTTENRTKVTGAVSTVKASTLNTLPVPTLDQALQGRVPGVVVMQNTGAPGEGVRIRIRGVGSVNSGNYPLWIVDGFPMTNISMISMNDVEDMTILKDASSAAIYGSRAANGVVVVTTKSGKGKKPQIQFNSQVGFQQPSRLIDMANTAEYVKIYNEAATTDNVGKSGIFLRPLISESVASTFADVNHIDEIMQDAVIQNYGLTFSGSNDKTSYLISANYFDQEGIIKGSDFSRFTARANVSTQVRDWLEVGTNINASRHVKNIIPSSGDGAGGNGGSVIRYAFFRTPGIPVKDENGQFVDLPTYPGLLGDGYNPVGMLAYNQNEEISKELFSRFFVRLTPIPGLKITTNFGFNSANVGTRRFDRNWGSNNRINNPNRLVVTETDGLSVVFNTYVNYDKSVGDHNFAVTLGTEAIKDHAHGVASTDSRFPDQKKSLVYLGLGEGIKTTSESESGSALASFFGKVSYDYNAKYLASATLRRDGSSRFSPGNRWGTFYAGSLGWEVKKEFLEDVNWIDRLLVRVGYGSIGNQEIPNNAYLAIVQSGYNYPFGASQSVGYSVSQLGNDKVKWETSNQLNAGIDFEIFNGSLLFTFDYFNRVTKDLLVRQPVPPSSGSAGPPIVNNGEILNRGIEIGVSHQRSYGDFNLRVSGNVGTLHNEVLKMDQPIQGGTVGLDKITLTEEGYPIGSFYLYEMEGIFQDATDVITHANQGPNIKPGDVKFKNQDGDTFITGNDRIHAGSPLPKVNAAFTLDVAYKSFSLTVFVQGAYGQDVFSVLNRDSEGFYRPFNVTQRYYDNHWTGPGTTNKYPRASWDASGNNNRMSTRFLEDGSYTRLKNVQLTYRLPKSFLERYGFSAAQVYVSGSNLLTFTQYQGLDPEMTTSDNARNEGEIASGIDWGTYPSARTYNVGVSLTF
jgi:TonB-dependent starch-binding outer membrane protein SusC